MHIELSPAQRLVARLKRRSDWLTWHECYNEGYSLEEDLAAAAEHSESQLAAQTQ